MYLLCKLYLGVRFENKQNLKQVKGEGFYLYGNHTRGLDAIIPSVVAFPKRAYVIAGPDVVSIKGLKTIVMLLGAIPIPTEADGMKKFMKALLTMEMFESTDASDTPPD